MKHTLSSLRPLLLSGLILLIQATTSFAQTAEEPTPAQQAKTMQTQINELFGERDFNGIVAQAPEALDFMQKNEQWVPYYQTAGVLSNAYRSLGDYDQALAEANKIYNFAKARNHSEGMGMALFSMSRAYGGLRRFAEQEEALHESIALLKDSESYLNVLPNVYTRLILSFIGQARYDEAMQLAAECEEVNRRYEKASGKPQLAPWVNLWIAYIDLYRQTSQPDQALYYIRKCDSATNGNMKFYKELGHVYYMKGEYAQALEELNKAIVRNPLSRESEALKLVTLIHLGEAQEADSLFRTIIAKQDSVSNSAFNAQIDELRTQYEVDKHVAEKQRNRNYFFFALAGCALLLLLLAGAAYHNRTITRKNRGLYQRIKEQDRLQKELAKVKSPQKEPQPGTQQQLDLIERLHQYLLSNNNLAKAEMNRDELIAALATNKNILSEAVKTVTGKTLMEYIRFMQLEEARRMLDDHPELTIEAIATDCGFNTTNTFYRLFRKRYEISPAEYRKASKM